MINIDLQGKTAFVTGGSRGIGKTIVEVLQSGGANVIAPTRSELDLSDISSIEAYSLKQKSLEVDIFIHCAGINELAGINEISQDLLSRVYDVNLFAPIHLLKAFAQTCRKTSGGV